MADPRLTIEERAKKFGGQLVQAEPHGSIEERAKKFGGTLDAQPEPQATPAPQGKGMGEQVSDFKDSIIDNMNPVRLVTGLRDLVNTTLSHPIGTAEAILEQQGKVGVKAAEAFKQGRYLDGIRHTIGYVLPVVGPEIDRMGDEAAAGNVGKAMGEAVAFGLNGALPGSPLMKSLAGKLKKVNIPLGVQTTLNPVEASAVNFATKEGIPLDLATVTGSKAARQAQEIVGKAPFSAGYVAKQRQGQATALASTLERKAAGVYEDAVTPMQAGEGMQTALAAKADGLGVVASTAYDKFRSIIEQPQFARPVTTAYRRTPMADETGTIMMGQSNRVPIIENVQLPVDLKELKDVLHPIHRDLKFMSAAERSSSAGFTAIEEVLKGADSVPAATAETALGYFKEMARGAPGRQAGMGKLLVSKLQPLIDDAVGNASPAALEALREGRAVTAQEMGVRGVAKKLLAEPVQAFNQTLYAKDAGVVRLREIAKEIPDEMPKLGRAYLGDLFEKATAQGGFDATDSVWRSWQNLGPETKKILFKNPVQVQELDDLFKVAKDIGKLENKSGSGTMVASMAAGGIAVSTGNGVALLAAPVVARLLYNPRAVALLKKGMKVPASPAASALIGAQLLNLAEQVKPQVGPGALRNVAGSGKEDQVAVSRN